MADEETVVVAIEDLSTAGAVAAEAVRLATSRPVTSLVLVHVLDEHPLINGMLGVTGAPVPLVESEDDGQRLLTVAERVIRNEFEALGVPAPAISHELARGHAGDALAHAVKEHNAAWIVLGARRPHLFGWLAHPDVKSHLATHAPCQVHVAPLQERSAAPAE
jgi:nucleotide-binding universal stress UspA family protein